MELIDFRRPSAGFADGLQLWRACHDRAMLVLGLFERLLVQVERHGADAAAVTTAGEVLRFFDEAMPRHHDDEDTDLFPVVLNRARGAGLNGEAEQAAATLERLSRDHRELDRQWPQMRDLLAQIDVGRSRQIDWLAVTTFVGQSIEHHAAEDRVVRPLAQRVLTPEDLGLLGIVMARRRGTTWDALAASN